MDLIRGTNLGLRFLLELAALASVGYWGLRAGDSGLARIALALGIPLAVAIIWGTFLSPNASVPLPGALTVALQLAAFAAAALALIRTGHASMGATFGGFAIVNAALLLAWG
jgi:hypothetical protein